MTNLIEKINTLPNNNIFDKNSVLFQLGMIFMPIFNFCGWLYTLFCIYGFFLIPEKLTTPRGRDDLVSFVLVYFIWFVWFAIYINYRRSLKRWDAPLRALEGYILEKTNHGFTVSTQLTTIWVDLVKGLIVINNRVCDEQVLNRHTIVIEFEKIKYVSGINNQIMLTLNSNAIPMYTCRSRTPQASNAQALIGIISSYQLGQFPHARGENYPAIREAMNKKGWMLD